MAKRFISLMLIFALVLSAFPVWASAESEQYYCNGSDMFNDGVVEFFLNSDDEDKLYVMDLTDKSMELVLEEHVISMVYADESLYMLVYRDGTSALVSFDLNSRSAVDMLCFADVITSIICRDHTIYYIENGNAVAFNPATGETQLLIDSGDVVHFYFVDYNTLRYYTEGATTGKTYYFDGSAAESNTETRSAATRATVTYTPRLTEPATDNPYYTTWNVFDQAGYGMVDNGGNCTCYAYGRSYENLGYEPSLCTGNAGDWYQYNINYGYYDYGSTPILGAVVVWSSSGAGHVGVVEVIDGDAVTTSESGWQSFYFRTKVRSASDANFSGGSAYTFLGFIYVLGTSVSPGVHEHNYSTFAFFEGDHPHYSCYSCSICGDIIRDEAETNYYDQCFICNTPSQPSLLNMSAAYPTDQSIVFQWNATTYTTHYNLWIEKENDSGEYVKSEYISYAESGVSRTLAEGNYRVQIQSYNFNFWEDEVCPRTFSDWCYFSVSPYYTCLINGHDTTTVTEDATCTQDGSTKEICKVCNQTISETVIPTSGHTPVTDAAIPASCTEAGLTEGSHCSVCNEILTPQETAAPTGHSLIEFAATEATCVTNGNLPCWICRSCMKVYADPEATSEITLTDIGVAAKGHRYTSAVTAPTCTEGGYTTFTCSVCGDVYTGDETTALGHSYTYADNGDGTHTVGCENCDYSEVEDHSFTDGTCICGAEEAPAIPTDANLKFISDALSLQSNINFQLTSNIKGLGYERYYVEVVRTDAESGEVSSTLESIQTGTNYVYFTYAINADHMTDSFTATVYGVKDGVVYQGQTYTGSARGKISALAATSTNAAQLTMFADLLKYGAEAQKVSGYNVSDLATDGISAALESYITTEVPEAADTITTSANSPVSVYKMAQSMTCADAVAISITLKKNNDVSNAYMEASYTDYKGVVHTEQIEFTLMVVGTATYPVAEFRSLTACDAQTAVTFTVKDKTTNEPISDSWTMSIEAMVGTMQSGTYASCANALLNYYNAAYAVFVN